MAGGRERAGEVRQLRSMLEVIGVRVRTAESELAEAREALAEAARYHGVCERDVETETARLQAIVSHLRTPEVASSGPRYTEMLETRDIVARGLGRERFMLDNAVKALDAARASLAEHQGGLARLRAREKALRERLKTLGKAREGRLALAAERETEELAAIRHALPVEAGG